MKTGKVLFGRSSYICFQNYVRTRSLGDTLGARLLARIRISGPSFITHFRIIFKITDAGMIMPTMVRMIIVITMITVMTMTMMTRAGVRSADRIHYPGVTHGKVLQSKVLHRAKCRQNPLSRCLNTTVTADSSV